MPETPCHCDDFSRTALIHRAAAEAGRGLPTIEPGMPLPAGTGLDRRTFLARSAGLVLAVYGATKVSLPGLDDGIAMAAASAPANDRVLISVFLDGGADSMSILFPAGEPNYYALRPRLAYQEADGLLFPGDDRLLWHSSAQSFAELYGEGKLAVFPAIGYTDPDQSHFTSRHYYEVGALRANLRTGWLGRYLDRVGSADNPLQGLALDGRLAPGLASARVPVAALSGPGEFNLWTSGVWGDVETRLLEAIGPMGLAGARSRDKAMREAGGVMFQAHRLRQQLRPFAGDEGEPDFASPVPYPEGDHDFPEKLAGVAAMLAYGLPLKCVALEAPGAYDTHSNQVGELESGIQLTADSLLAFQRDLEARGLADRVVVHVWSEFGRRAKENGSNGTDHGAAGIGFVMGTQVQGGMFGEFPGLTNGLDERGNLRATSDFRGLYSALLEQWLQTDAGSVIPGAGTFVRPGVIR